MSDSSNTNLLKTALVSSRAGDIAAAEEALQSFIASKFNLQVTKLAIRQDTLSLNSINGTLDSDRGVLFFKFHMEESEETVQEYYRAELLSNAGYPVESPLYVSKDVGEQILIYPYKASERLADMCRRLEADEAPGSEEYSALIKGQQELDKICAQKCIETMVPASSADLLEEPLLQLFYWRLVDVDGGRRTFPGGRYKDYYRGATFLFPDGVQLSREQLFSKVFVVNGRRYPVTLEEAFKRADTMLAPEYLDEYIGCTAHGDAHNGNVWANKDSEGKISLSWFDPAFAGTRIPVLLAEVKSLFHNIFAHPNWLYDAKDADPNLQVRCRLQGDELHVEHNWILPDLRREFLESKLENFWAPVCRELKARNALPANWEDYVRAALFCCPTLVMNLVSAAGTAQNSHTPQTSLLGLSLACMLVCEPENEADCLSEFFNKLRDLISK
jgi:hypothetical protein